MAEYTCCSSVAFARPNEHAFTLHLHYAPPPHSQVCGDASVYCPTGSYVPTPVTPGYYTIGNDGDARNTTRVSQALCPVGHFCTGGVLYQCPGAWVRVCVHACACCEHRSTQ
jgi:hypothetical protein